MHFALLARFLFSVLKPLVIGVVTYLGLGIITYTGVNYGLDFFKDFIMSGFGAATPELKQILGLAKVDIAINIILSAASMKFAIMGFSKAKGTLKQFRMVGGK